MRLALVTHDVVRGDGQGRFNYELASHALARGVEVSLVADRVDADLLELGAKWIHVHPRLKDPQLAKVREFARLASRAIAPLRTRVDLIHANGFVLVGAHDVNTAHFVHGEWRRIRRLDADPAGAIRSRYDQIYSRLNSHWERRAFRQAQVVVAVSNLVRDGLAKAGVPAERTRVIPNGVDLDEFCPGPADYQTPGVPAGVPLALFVGDLRTARKNVDTLLRACAQVSGLHLAVAGNVSGSRYPELARELGFSDRVHFLGFRPDVSELLRATDFLVCPSRYDPFSLVLLEALASGVPVVTTTTVGAAEIVRPSCGIVLDDAGDVTALSEALRRLSEDDELRTSMAAAARSVAVRYSWASVAEAYLRLYDEALAS